MKLIVYFFGVHSCFSVKPGKVFLGNTEALKNELVLFFIRMSRNGIEPSDSTSKRENVWEDLVEEEIDNKSRIFIQFCWRVMMVG